MSATVTPSAVHSAGEEERVESAGRLRVSYLRLLAGAFTLFSTIRIFAYVPTVWAIVQSADSGQHSLWTWITWTGANVTMAAWLYEHGDQRLNRAIAVSIGNAVMCGVTTAVILWFRRWGAS